MNNFYEITNIDSATNAVYAHFVYGEAVLDETVFVTDITDKNEITSVVSQAYSKFQKDIDLANSAPDLPKDVNSLIGVKQEVLETSIKKDNVLL